MFILIESQQHKEQHVLKLEKKELSNVTRMLHRIYFMHKLVYIKRRTSTPRGGRSLNILSVFEITFQFTELKI